MEHKTTMPTRTITLGSDTFQHHHMFSHTYDGTRNNILLLVSYGRNNSTDDILAGLDPADLVVINGLLATHRNCAVRCLLSPRTNRVNWFVYLNVPNNLYAHKSAKYIDRKLTDYKPAEIHVYN